MPSQDDVAAFAAEGLSVRLAHPHEVGWMLHEHYLGKWPAVSTAIVALCRDDRPVGCIVFAVPPRETIQRYGDETWELARLWVADSEPPGRPYERVARVSKPRYVLDLGKRRRSRHVRSGISSGAAAPSGSS